jgi:hypothetical protein
MATPPTSFFPLIFVLFRLRRDASGKVLIAEI